MKKDSYNEINRAMSRETETDETIQMTSADLEPAESLNRNPEEPIDPDKLKVESVVIQPSSAHVAQKYRFVRSIGRGGMKMVLQVTDRDSMRDVAMAVLPDAAARPHEEIARFVREARITASLEHPNIVPVHDIGVDANGVPFYTMKLLRGRTLASLIEHLANGDTQMLADYHQKRMLRIFLKICYGVSFAHSRGVIHLDLKPDNIQIGDFGEVLVMDWGLAKVIDEKHVETDIPNFQFKSPDEGLTTEDGVMKGTPGYMAPEQAAGKNSQKDTRTDIYSLGAILYAMMTYKNPLEEKNVRGKIDATLNGRFRPPRERAPEREIPAAVEAIILKAMSLRPEDRYSSVKEIRDEVNAFINGYVTIAENASVLKKSMLFIKRHGLLASFFALLVFLGIAATLYIINEQRRDLTSWKNIAVATFERKLDEDVYFVTDSNNNLRPDVTGILREKQSVVLTAGDRLWFQRDVFENLLIDIGFNAHEKPQPVYVFLRADKSPELQNSAIPFGYIIAFSADGSHDMICRNEPGIGIIPVAIAVAPTAVVPGPNHFTIRRTLNKIEIFRGKSAFPYLEADDMIPLTRFGGAGAGAGDSTVEITDLKLAVQLFPQNPTPLVQGDTLMDLGDYRQACSRYSNAAEAYPNDTLADDALVNAYMAAKLSGDPECIRNTMKRIKLQPAFSRKGKLLAIDAVHFWYTGDFKRALDCIDTILQGTPDSDIMDHILSLPHKPLPPEIAPRFMERVAKMKRNWLDLSGYHLESLYKINDKKLDWLDVRNNPDLPDPEKTMKKIPAKLQKDDSLKNTGVK